MKFLFFISLLTLVFNLKVKSQDCGNFYPFEKGTEVELTSYNRKGKVDGKIIYKVAEVKDSNEGKTATIEFDLYDKKGKQVEMTEEMVRNFDVRCDGEMTYIDMESMMATNPALSGYQEMEVTMEGESLMIPNNISVGESLPDAMLVTKINMGVMNMTMNMNINNREVVAREKLTTPAGTFDTYIITYDSEFKMGVSKKSSGKQWIAENVGMVKEEHYNDNGKLISYTELTGLKK